MTSIEERLREVRNALSLIIASLTVDDTDEISPVTRRDLNEAMFCAATRAHDEIYWLTRLPATILNTVAPTDDDLEQGTPEGCADERPCIPDLSSAEHPSLTA